MALGLGEQVERMLVQQRMIADLQRQLVPRVLPHSRDWRLASHYSVGAWPGGDYFDAWRLSDGRLVMLVADASDHGSAAAVLVALVRSALHSCPLSSGVERLPFCPFHDPLIQPPNVILGHLNRVLCENSLEEQFMTAFIGILSPRDGSFRFANAGHPPPRWWQAESGRLQAVNGVAGLPLGLTPDSIYGHGAVQLARGDLLLFYSDGLTEAQDADGRLFGRDRLDAVVRESAPRGVEAVKSAVLASLDDFMAGTEPQDDVTLLVLGGEQDNDRTMPSVGTDTGRAFSKSL